MSRLIPAALEKRYQTANARLNEVRDLVATDDAALIAKYRDLVTAWGEMVDVYAEAGRLPSVGSGLLWSALYDAGTYARNRRSEIEHELKTLGGES